MKLGLITMLAALHDSTPVENSHYEFISSLKGKFDVVFIDPEDVDYVDFSVVFIASGGTEGMFRNIYDALPKPVYLLTDGLHNSFSAALEILAWIKDIGDESEILHGDIEYLNERILYLHRIKTVNRKLTNTSIGVLGFPSEWLISSNVNYSTAKRKWGVTYKNIELDDFVNVLQTVDDSDALNIARGFISSAKGMLEPNEKDVHAAARVYLAVKEMCTEYELDAITIKCFDLIKKHGTTGCMAMSLLNSEGIVAGCEGDCQSTFSMLISRYVTQVNSFMTNPSSVSRSRNEIILAHCTVATDIIEDYIIRDHFDSRSGVGIQGRLPEGPVTVFKCGGYELDKYFLSRGTLVENMNEENVCRTQVRIKLEEDVSYFLRNPLANHHLVIPGDHYDELNDLMHSAGCVRIK